MDNKFFRQQRRLHEITQKEVADAIGVTKVAISRFEKGTLMLSNYKLYLLEQYAKQYLY